MVTNGRLRYSSSAMEHLFVDGLPPSVGKGTLLRLLIEDGGLNKHRVGKIVLNGGVATVEVADGWAARLVRVLDGMQVETRRIRVWQQPQTGNNAHFDQLLRWLVLEAEAERQQQAADDDASLTRLVIRGEEMGLGERVLVQLAPRNEQAHLPATRLSVGSPVILREEEGTASWRGVVSRLGRQRLEVALNEPPETAVSTFRLDLAHDEVARQRMQRALARVAAAQGNQTAVLRDVILGLRPAEFLSNRVPAQLHPLTERLNESQKTAVVHALAAEHLAIIHGPPGTGKTTTVAALIATAAQRGDRVLACAPSNLAVDNLAERLAAAGVPLVRLGHPVRVLPELQAYTLDALVEQHDNYRQAKKLRKEAFGLQNQAGKFRRARPERGAKEAMREEARAMLDEARQLEAQAVERVLDGAAVVLSTLTALDSSLLGQRRFDLGVIDEAGQSVEPASWIPLPRVDRLVLAGDHQQLPPTILSQQAQAEGFGVSMLEQLMRRDGAVLARRLDVQYRMHEQIMGFSAAEFYEGTLVAETAVSHHLLADLPGVKRVGLTETAVWFIDTAGASYDEEQPRDSASRRNPQEAALAAQKVTELLAAGVSATDIAVITPYSAQVELLRELLPEAIEVGSVDGFQGREKEAIVISLVRSNETGEVGFLAETRRMNVALTRARRLLLVIGDSGTITADLFYGRLLDYFDQIGAYHSVWE